MRERASTLGLPGGLPERRLHQRSLLLQAKNSVSTMTVSFSDALDVFPGPVMFSGRQPEPNHVVLVPAGAGFARLVPCSQLSELPQHGAGSILMSYRKFGRLWRTWCSGRRNRSTCCDNVTNRGICGCL